MSNNPAGLSHQEILALRAASGAPGSLQEEPQTFVVREAAPDISQRAQKVTRPGLRDKEGNQITDSNGDKIRGPRLEFVTQQEKIRAQERLELLEAEEARKKEREAMRPENILSRLAYLEREVRRLSNALKKQVK